MLAHVAPALFCLGSDFGRGPIVASEGRVRLQNRKVQVDVPLLVVPGRAPKRVMSTCRLSGGDVPKHMT